MQRSSTTAIFPALRIFALALGLSAAAHAQLGIHTLPAFIGDDPRGVHYIGNGHVVVSERVDGWQHFVDVSNPSAPTLTTSFNPPWGDQWFEAEYTELYGGRLFTGHRSIGLNMIDVSNPSAPALVDSKPSGYHFRGLRFQRNGIDGRLFYNATNQGLQVWDVQGFGSSLAQGWDNFAPNRDGNGLELLGDDLFQLGAPPFSSGTRELRTFQALVNTNPAQCSLTTFNNQGSGHAQIRKSQLPCARMIASKWEAGLDLIDATSPCNPVTIPLFPSQVGPFTFTYWGSASVPATPTFVVYGSYLINNDPSTRTYFWWFWTVPATGFPIPGLFLTVPLDTRDIQVDPNTYRVYVVGRNTGSGNGELWIF